MNSFKEQDSSIVYKYDSLDNFIRHNHGKKDEYGLYEKTYHHLIGQTIIYCGDPYAYCDNYEWMVGKYFRVDAVFPNIISEGKYDRLYLRGIGKDNDTSFVFDGDAGSSSTIYNRLFIVSGHIEKLKKMYVGHEYTYIGLQLYYFKAVSQDLISVENNQPNSNITKGSVWSCIDVQVLPRKKSYHDGPFDDYSPVVIVLNNPQYGNYYCFYDERNGVRDTHLYKNYPVFCGFFIEKKDYDKIQNTALAAKKRAVSQKQKTEREKEESQRRRHDRMIEKYGKTTGEMIFNGQVRIGFTKAMCKDAWGEPAKVNRTTTASGIREQWVYGNRYLYFDNGKLTAIQD